MKPVKPGKRSQCGRKPSLRLQARKQKLYEFREGTCPGVPHPSATGVGLPTPRPHRRPHRSPCGFAAFSLAYLGLFILQKPKQSSSSETEHSSLFPEFKNTFLWALCAVCRSQTSVAVEWGWGGREKRFGDTTLIVSKSRKYKSSQNSFLQIEASSKTSKAHFFFHFSSAAVTSTGTCF